MVKKLRNYSDLSTPFFSVIIPTFNRAYILGRTIDSVRHQSFEDWELLIIDDGSTDRSKLLISEQIASEPRIRYFERDIYNIKGASTCRNIGIENAQGAYIAFLDSDDYWSFDRLENAWAFIQKTNAQATYSGALINGRNGDHFRCSRPIDIGESLFDFILKSNSFIPTPSLIIESKIANSVKFNTNLKNHEDYDFFIRVGNLCDWMFYDGKEVVIDWKDNASRKIDYESCLWFFNNYKYLSKEKHVKVNYLLHMTQDMIYNNSSYLFLKEYYCLLKDEKFNFEIKHLFMFNFPRIFKLLLSIENIRK